MKIWRRFSFACTVVLLASLQALPARSAEGLLQGFPIGLICVRDGAVSIAYLSQISADGTATYLSRGNRFGFTITADGPSLPRVDAASGSECIGKTLEMFEAEGLTIKAVN